MAFYDYHFVTHWKIRGPIRKIYDVLKEGARYSEWWRPAYLKTEEVGPRKVRSLVRAKLPYTLDFTTELVRERPPTELEIKASGELAGTGLWKLNEKDGWTRIEFYWDVRAEKPLVRWLSFLLKPLFRWNHDWVMKVGERGLQEEIIRNIPTRGA
jgi:hypothetical protein